MEDTPILIPDTVGEMIEFLNKFPKDWRLDVYCEERDWCSTFEQSVYKMIPREYSGLGIISLTFKD